MDLHQLHLTGSLDLQLTCRLEDKYLTSVPPLHILVPRDYPRTAPRCEGSQQSDYGIMSLFTVLQTICQLTPISLRADVSPFTRTVLQSLLDRLRHMPPRYSISQILNCWEMALRHACRPPGANKLTNPSSMTLALGI